MCTGTKYVSVAVPALGNEKRGEGRKGKDEEGRGSKRERTGILITEEIGGDGE